MKTYSNRSKKKHKNKEISDTNLALYGVKLRMIAFIASLILAGITILLGIDSPIVWTFLGYAIGSSGSGIKSI
ncbi:MAG: hypothetical protein J0M11_04465 [Anaerolineae bacterium]|nr:hypothetical protein [Anaerolineae bacterium]